MDKLPAKQIYLLSIIVIGIITLSVYSTYAIFTLESETSDIVNLETANVLDIDLNTYEYKQITINPDTSISTDIDLYNNYDYDICYSIWYKVVPSKDINTNLVSIYQNTNESLTTSGNLKPVGSKRINIIVKNNNDKPVKVNIGVSYSKNEETCELNISKDKKLISSTMDDTKILSDIINKNTEIKNNKSNYITYQDKTDNIILNNKIYISTKYTYEDEIFSLVEPIQINTNELNNYINNDTYYTCINDNKCRYLYRIKELKDNNLTKYDLMIGYLSGQSGIRKVNQNNYYYGDNPNNFIYFNCDNELDKDSCELWRIIGTFYNKEDNKYITKIIKNNSIDITNYGNNNSWKDSNILTKLKEYKIKDESLLQEVDYKIENLTNLSTNINEIPLLADTYKSNIMLMNLSDYLNTSICQNNLINEYDDNCLNNNWLNNNYPNEEWTMTIKYNEPYIDNQTNQTIIPNNNIVYSIGSSIKESLSTTNINIRPVVYLKSTTIFLEGNGSFEDPYVIK